MLNYIRTLWRPEAFHGTGKKTNYFEGWFFKAVNATTEKILAFIPGIFLSKNSVDSHAFIQILEGGMHQSAYHRFPISDFFSSPKKLEIRIRDNIFESTGIKLNLQKEGHSITGKLLFHDLKSWPVTLTSPGVMGWYAFVPFMECFHGVVSLDHRIEGSISLDHHSINFDNGRGYIEKDWGTSFPRSYIWIQSNHFEKAGVSLMVSVARIPWLTGAFRGFIIGLLLDDNLLKFTTYTGARLNYLKITDTHVSLEVTDRHYKLKIQAVRSEGGLLHAPYERQMLQRVSETLSSQVEVWLFQVENGKENLIFSGKGTPAGLDVNGKLAEIVD